MTKLCVAIPTFNRAEKLKKALKNLLKEILKIDHKNKISVLVSDNGSSDETENVINNYKENFEQNGINFIKKGFCKNQGFDKNLFNCYNNNDSEYIWFLSDDDIISRNALSIILKDINAYSPNVIYYNFDQPPFTRKNKYISTTYLYDQIKSQNLEVISKIIRWPKLSAIVLKKFKIPKSFIEKNFKFMHTSLAVYLGLKKGSILQSNKFIAKVDEDYLDNIDFEPFVGNYTKDNTKSLMTYVKCHDLFKILNKNYPFNKVDRADSCLNYMTIGYISGTLINKDLERKINKIIRKDAYKKGIKVLISLKYLKYGYAYLHKYFPLSYISFLRKKVRQKYKSRQNIYRLLRKKISNFVLNPKKFFVKSYSQLGEDLLIKAVFDSLGISHPTYLDIGANHPYYLSNTYLFYSTGSKGVLIEPNIVLCKNLKKKRKKDKCINCGVGISDESTANFYIMDADVLSTFSEQEAELIEEQGTYQIEKIVSVPLVNINNIIDKYFKSTPDFISIDIEGMDYAILKSFDFLKHRPALFCAETLKYDEKRRAPKITKIIEHMIANDYFVYADTHLNTIFVDKQIWK